MADDFFQRELGDRCRCRQVALDWDISEPLVGPEFVIAGGKE